jgi:RNA polymerase subunit RPABC4/transcription elongation factor Spt4
MPQLPPELFNFIGVAAQMIVAVSVSFLVALWVSLAIWTFRDIRARTRDFFAWLLAIILVLALGPVGLLFYFLLRPRETLAESYDRQLEEEALLRDITARRACPTCQTVTEPAWLLCPRCRTELRRRCSACEQPMELDWVACPFCTTAVSSNGKGARITLPVRPRMWAADEDQEVVQVPPQPAASTD